jgi:hypothetical protein
MKFRYIAIKLIYIAFKLRHIVEQFCFACNSYFPTVLEMKSNSKLFNVSLRGFYNSDAVNSKVPGLCFI